MCWLLCVALFLEGWTLRGPGRNSSRLQKQRSTQPTAHSHSTVKCNPSVTITKSSPWRWPSRVETCRSVLRLKIKLSFCICWWLVFLYIVYIGVIINVGVFHTEEHHVHARWRHVLHRTSVEWILGLTTAYGGFQHTNKSEMKNTWKELVF
jgi:hypothetical protein